MNKHPRITKLEQHLDRAMQLLKGTVEHSMRQTFQAHYVERNGQIVSLNLGQLNLKDQQIDFLTDFPFLEGLNLMGNELERLTIPDHLSRLRLLDLSENKNLSVFELPISCENLEVLDLNECALEQFILPAKTIHLRKLDISRNKRLQQINIQGPCPTLQHLDLSDNQLNGLELQEGFTQLRYLYLNDNQLAYLTFDNPLPELKTLHLRNNQLNNLPKYILGSAKLDALYMHGNPWKEIPVEFIEEDERKSSWEKVRGYLRPLAKLDAAQKVSNDEVKLVFLGNSTVGKSSLFKYLKTGQYDKKEPSTHGIINVFWKKEEHPQLKQNVNVWDFGGQEFYHATHRLFLSSNAVTLVLFDEQTNVQAIVPTKVKIKKGNEVIDATEEMEHFPYAYWLDSIAHFGGYTQDRLQEIGERTLLVQTKFLDSQEREILIPDTIRGKYGLKDANIHRIDTEGACDENPKATTRFQLFKDQLFQTLESATQSFELPKYWLTIKEKVRELAEQEQAHLMYARYQGICEKIRPNISVLEEGEQHSELENLTGYLHEIGVLLHFKNEVNPLLSNRVFVDPEWVAEAIYEVLDYDVVTHNHGTFDLTHVQKVVRSKGVEAQTMVDLMKAFRLIFTVKDKPDQFVAPQYLPVKNPEANSRSFKNTRKRCCHHLFSLFYPTFLPRSIMTGFLCNYGDLSENLFWRDGIVIQKGVAEGTLYEYLIERQTDTWQTIAVYGQIQDEQLTSELFEVFLGLSKEIADLHVSVNGDDFVALQPLEEALQIGNAKVRSQKGNFCDVTDFSTLFQGKGSMEMGGLRHRAASHPKSEELREQEEASTPSVLFLSSCPPKLPAMRFGTEQRLIEDAYRSGRYRTPGKEPVDKTDVHGTEILPLLSTYRPEVLHISVHGSKVSNELLFMDKNGGTDRYKPTDFWELIARYRDEHRTLKVILFNACHSIEHAELNRHYADCVIGMQDYIPDDMALTYTEVFYKNLYAGIAAQDAHAEAISYIRRVEQHFTDFADRKFDFYEIPVLFYKGRRL